MKKTPAPKAIERCAYIRACYLAEELKCFGYRTDCVLYLKTNGKPYSEERFHEAMDKLINKIKAKHERLLT